MPDKKGRFTHKERTFVKHMATTGNREFAATKAGYVNPVPSAAKLMSNPIIANATREEGQRLLREKAGTVGIITLLQIATDTLQPANARVTASKYLSDAAGMRIDTESPDKSPAEMTAVELQRAHAETARRLEILESAKADAARPIIDADPAPIATNSGAFE